MKERKNESVGKEVPLNARIYRKTPDVGVETRSAARKGRISLFVGAA